MKSEPDENESENTTAQRVETELVSKLVKTADADVFLYAGEMHPPADRIFSKCVQANVSRKNVILFLATFGGSADAAYRVARCLHSSYPDGTVSLNVVEVCKSAGTLIAIGASELVMDDTAELGPLDVQIAKHDTLNERTSGLTPVQSLSTLREETFKFFETILLDVIRRSGGRISTRSASTAAVSLTSGLFRPIFAQIDPMKLGEYGRSLLVADDYGQRLNARFSNLKSNALTQLVAGYASHEFVIDRTEAGELFSAVRPPTPVERGLAAVLSKEVWHVLGNNNQRMPARIRCLSQRVEKERSNDTERGSNRVAPSPASGKSVETSQGGEPNGKTVRAGRRSGTKTQPQSGDNGVPKQSV